MRRRSSALELVEVVRYGNSWMLELTCSPRFHGARHTQLDTMIVVARQNLVKSQKWIRYSFPMGMEYIIGGLHLVRQIFIPIF